MGFQPKNQWGRIGSGLIDAATGVVNRGGRFADAAFRSLSLDNLQVRGQASANPATSLGSPVPLLAVGTGLGTHSNDPSRPTIAATTSTTGNPQFGLQMYFQGATEPTITSTTVVFPFAFPSGVICVIAQTGTVSAITKTQFTLTGATTPVAWIALGF